jgi:prepilin-type N-terminal cleavage/methylation domain-containing protein
MVTNVVRGEAGFSLVELLIAMGISLAVMAAATTLARGVQQTYQHQLHDVTVEQEARYALDWMSRTIVSAGSNPYSVNVTNCPAAGTPVRPIRIDPDGDGANDDIRIQTDSGIPNGLIVGQAGACNEPNEDITIARDAANNVITRFDAAVDAGPVAMTEPIFTNLQFTYLAANMTVTSAPGSIRFVRIAVQGRSRGRNPHTGQFTTFSLQQDVRLRAQ